MTDETTEAGEMPAPPAVESFDGWLAAQPETVKALVASHTGGLKSALEAERQQRKEFSRQLREATAAAEKGSAAEKALQDITGRAELAERRAAFFEEASRADIGCTNTRAAYLVATAENLFSSTGEPDWKRIKTEAPELFQRRASTANAGNGTQSPPQPNGMNEFIRRAAGRA